MDEYLGMSESHTASFRRYVREKLVDHVHPRAFYGLQGDAADAQAEIARYAALLREHRPVAVVMGIGENGHLAFNDPPADFTTTAPYLVVALDEECRRQQVGEGWFPSLDAVPTQAISMSVRRILASRTIICSVPDRRKAEAVKASLEGPLTPIMPASILRQHPDCRIHLDRESASLLAHPPA